jgi:hypothetical protein
MKVRDMGLGIVALAPKACPARAALGAARLLVWN